MENIMKKKMLTVAVALLSSTYLLAHGVGKGWNSNSQSGQMRGGNYGHYQMMGNNGGHMMGGNYGGHMMGNWGGSIMGEAYNTLHNSNINVDSLDNGVKLTITSDDQENAAAIQKIISEKQDQLTDYLKNIDVEITSVDDGITVQLTSEDESIIKQLQYDRGMIINHLVMSAAPDNAQGYADCWSGQNNNTAVN